MEIREIKATRNITDRNRLAERHLLRVAPYCRVSTDKEDQLHSYQSQVQYYTDLVNSREDWILADIYADEGITGTMTKKRESFQKMINDCLDGKIDMVITKSISRFARNTLDTLKYVRMLKEKNIAVFFEEENINTMTMDGELLLTILSSVAQQEVENLSENVKKGLKMKMKRGELVGFQGCMGFDYDSETKNIKINEEEAKIVRYIFQRYIEGAGGTIIARELNEMGTVTKKGVAWTAPTVIGIIRNEKYKGDLLLGKTFTVDPISKRRLINYGEEDMYYVSNHHEAIVSDTVFAQAQEILNYRCSCMNPNNTEPDRSKYSRKYPFSSIMKCAYCGESYTRRTWHSGSKYHKIIWGCISVSKYDKEFCPYSKGIPEAEIEKAFVESYKLLFGKNKDLVEDFLKKAEESLGQGAMQGTYRQVLKDIRKIKEKKKRLINLHINEDIDLETYQKEHDKLEKKLIDLEKVRDGIGNWEKQEEALKVRLVDFRNTLAETDTIDEFDPQIFNCLIKEVIVGGYDDEGNIDPYRLTFVYKTGFESTYTGYKGRRKKKKSREKELSQNRSDDPLPSAQNAIYDTCGGGIFTPETERVIEKKNEK